MRTTTAFFAGVGTVAVAIAAGLGGGLLFANMVAPHQPKYAAEPTKLEQRMATRTIPVTARPSEPVPYLAATQAAATNPAVVAAPQAEAAPPPAEQKPEAELKAAEPKTAEPKPEETKATANAATEQAAPSPAERAAVSPRDAFAKARDSDFKPRDADARRAAVEKRRSERRQQWADRRRDRQPRVQELEAVERSVRDVTEPRQAFMAEPARMEIPRINLFGDD